MQKWSSRRKFCPLLPRRKKDTFSKTWTVLQDTALGRTIRFNQKIVLPKTILYYGRDEALLAPLQLRAGPLTMIFEPASAFLRHVRLGDHEVVRAIYGAVRDQNWATIPPVVSNLQQEIGRDSFRLSFDVVCREKEVDFLWHGSVVGDSDGRVCYTFDGRARSQFLRNRIGLCVLHPILECSGQPCLVTHTNGVEERGAFPKSISPHQPFMDIKAVSYAIATTGATAEMQFEGEVFEMEDQRNWTDASFKTYSTPQSLPKPVKVEPGNQVRHSVTLNLKGLARPILPVLQGRPPQVAISTTPLMSLPPIGVGVARHGQALSAREIERLKLLHPSHLRVDLNLSSEHYPRLLGHAAAEASQLGTGLHLALILSDRAEPELRGFTEELARLRPKVLLWLIFHEAEEATQEKWLRLAQSILQNYSPAVLMAAGTRQFFTELNRDRPPKEAPFFPCFPVNPQVHMIDQTTLIENLAGQAAAVETVREFSARPAVVSPITLRVPAPPEQSEAPELPADVDPRQMSLFGAGWTLGSISRLAATGNVHSLTYFETTGWRGLMELEAGPARPGLFPSLPGCVFPVYHLLADIADFPGKQIYPTHSSHPLLVEALTLVQTSNRRRILVANLTGDLQETKIKTGGCKARVRYLDETNAEDAMRNPEEFRAQQGAPVESVSGKIELRLLPFGLARIDIG